MFGGDGVFWQRQAMSELQTIVDRILKAQRSINATRSLLAAITGIDGSGKGYVAARIRESLQTNGIRVAAINIDGWLNLPEKRFDPSNPAEHFYGHAIRFDEMFERLVVPLRDRRSVRCEADFAEETATQFRKHVYVFEDIDVILLEGIYLLKRSLQSHYDLSFWIECSFETALERAISRSQEGLSPDATIQAYRTIYFPAQLIHFERDEPKAAASLIVNNDPGRVSDNREKSTNTMKPE
jgi:uridine kinase